MTFNSVSFFVFIAAVLAVFYVSPYRFRARILLAASMVFYLSYDGKVLLLVLATAAWTYLAGSKIEESQTRKKSWLFAGILPVIGVLFVFKYINFFTESVVKLLRWFSISANEMVLELFLAVGLSYYSFKVISYLADIYKGKISAEKDFGNYLLYVTFFPQMVSGPIERACDFLPQLEKNLIFDRVRAAEGLELILIGYFKKLVLSNRIAVYVEGVYGNIKANTGLSLFFAAFFYSIQIYCDFSGYSDIAIGIGNLFGLTTKKNFNCPYLSRNIKEFWKRWHISLSSFLMDYIYIPLGGSRVSKIKRARNLMATFLVSGLWHGASWTFVFWGGIHGLFNLIFGRKRREAEKSTFLTSCISVLNGLFTFTLVSFAWIFFRMGTLKNAFLVVRKILFETRINYYELQNSILLWTFDNMCVAYFLTVCFCILVLFIWEWRQTYLKKEETSGVRSCFQVFWVMAILLFGVFGESSFIYANF